MKSPNIKQKAEIHSAVISPAIELDSADGHTTIRSRAIYAWKNPTTVTF